MSEEYSFEYLLCGCLRKFSLKMNGDDQIEEPVQDEIFSCTTAQRSAIHGHIEATRRLAHAFGPGNIDTVEVIRAGSGLTHSTKQ
jgi:hypothetical protein